VALEILLIRQIDRACRSRENSAPSEGFESRGIVRERCGKVPSKRLTATILGFSVGRRSLDGAEVTRV